MSHDSRPPETAPRPGQHRRSSSDASPGTGQRPQLSKDAFDASKRLAFFGGDKVSLPQAPLRSATPVVPATTHPRVHSRADSVPPTRDNVNTVPAPSSTMASPPSTSKMHASPSKTVVASGRTYDAKLLTREMHRLGTLAHLPAALAPGLAAAASSSTLTLSSTATLTPSSASNASGDRFWAQLHVHVLPLFNGDPLQIPIEDLNTLVKRHIETVMSRGPSRALNALENDAAELINSGMITLNAKLTGIDDEKLVSRVVEIWGFFWDQVLPYVEGVFLPLQMDSLLLSLYRTPKSQRPTSPTLQDGKNSLTSMPTQANPPIDIRTLALRAFRDKIIYPISTRLEGRLQLILKRGSSESAGYQQPRLQQMLLVLLSQTHRTHLLSLTASPPQLSPPEAAVRMLLDTIQSHSPHAALLSSGISSVTKGGDGRPPSFLSGGIPRDRRGRVAQKPKPRRRASATAEGEPEDDGDDGGETPRNRFMGTAEGIKVDRDRERDQDFLDGLRSPDVEDATEATRMGGWGLGGGREERAVEDDDDEALDWDQTQAEVERMVGMNGSDPQQPPQARRKMT